MTDVLNLFSEEPEQYGPKKRIDTGERRKTMALVSNPKRGDYLQGIGEWKGPNNPIGTPPLDWRIIERSKDEARQRIIHAMCPVKVCRLCGEPSRRIVESERFLVTPGINTASQTSRLGAGGTYATQGRTEYRTLGFSDCGHNNWRPGVVLDPFQPGDEMTATFYVGDAIETMNKLPEKSVDLILTSPPFLALRSYLPADHPDKALEGGSQATPGIYIDWLIDVVEACDRVLAPHGSLCIELGDTYSGKSGWGDELGNERYPNGRGVSESRPNASGPGWPLAKSLSLIPELFRLTLVYGTNPLTGRQTERWRLRNVVRWVRPNPPVGALGDKFRPATSELMVFCKSAKRYFDLDAVREPHSAASVARVAYGNVGLTEKSLTGPPTSVHVSQKAMEDGFQMNPAGAPPLDWWNIPPGGYEGAHYAVFPPELCIKPIKAMSPERVCRVCGEPSRRISEVEFIPLDDGKPKTEQGYVVAAVESAANRGHGYMPAQGMRLGRAERRSTTTGWTGCGHDDWRPGLVLDCFAGSGTTLLVATGHGRDAIGIDLDERNFNLALERVGPLVLSGPYRLDDSATEPPPLAPPAVVQTPVDVPLGGPL